MTVGEFCEYLNSDDLIVITKPDGAFASGYIYEMEKYFAEEILHIKADKYPIATMSNNHVGYELKVA